MAYSLLIHLEKCEGNFEDARLWAYDCLDKYPGSTNALAIRQQLVEMARKEGNRNEVIAQLREIINIHPEHKSANKMLKSIQKEGR